MVRLGLECGDNDQREAAPLWLFGLSAWLPLSKAARWSPSPLSAALHIWRIGVDETAMPPCRGEAHLRLGAPPRNPGCHGREHAKAWTTNESGSQFSFQAECLCLIADTSAARSP